MKTSKSARIYVVRAFLAASLGGLFVAGACASIPDEHRYTYLGPTQDPTQPLAPNFATYAGTSANPAVDRYLGQRCATLDCHGQIGRPLRIFATNGLRSFDAAGAGGFPNKSGSGATTDDEIKANYFTVIGLEPELMAQVIAGGGRDPKKLLLLKKPLLLESHKGGQVMTEGDDGYKCITSWIAGTGIDQQACTNSIQIP